ncbi:MAG: hypothetical protein QOG83_2744 [Alphaproteobacteria bacterium]|nr:hypothetical protein [Alphaproteobacteria bacterium]
MTRALVIRLLLAAVLACASVIDRAPAQTRDPQPPTPIPSRSNNNKAIWTIVGGAAVAIIGLVIGTRIFDPPVDQANPPSPPPREPPTAQLPPNLPTQGPAPTGPGQIAPALRNGFFLPPPGETRFVSNEVMLDIPSTLQAPILDVIAARHAMTRLETRSFRLTGRTLHRWRIDAGATVPDMIRGLSGERQVAGAAPIYLFQLSQDALVPASGDQYAPDKIRLTEAHRLATGSRMLIAMIDSGVDARHPDLAGAVNANLDAATGDLAPHPHGTGMAGAIAARQTMLSVAPRVSLLTVRAFNAGANNGEGTTFNIIKGLDWAAERGARIVNMSFAGPRDPSLERALQSASGKGIILIAAAGNAGPRSPPLYPAADKNVIAVTATDVDDKLFTNANRGRHIAIAAPGVDILVPAPDGTYQLTTGTSVASAEVSGVVALMLERNPRLTSADVRRILTASAKKLGPNDQFGAGLIDAFAAVTAAKPR